MGYTLCWQQSTLYQTPNFVDYVDERALIQAKMMQEEINQAAEVSRQKISVVIAVYNEEKRIARCLDALKWADQIVMVDMFSQDRTEEISLTYSNVVFLKKQDYMNANVNYGIDHAAGDWIMRLDSDEIITLELALEIQKVAADPSPAYDGYWVPSRTFYFGKWMRYGVTYDTRFGTDRPGFGYRKVLFRKGCARYECRTEHEDITVTGTWGVLKGHYDHFSHRSVSHYINKMMYYTDRDVERLDVLAPGYRLPTPGRTMVALVTIFTTHYIKRKGYKEGRYGFISCALATLYIFVERCKIWEKHYRLTHPDEITQY